jgi:hypothetical protein
MVERCESCRWAATVNDREGLACVRFPPTYSIQQHQPTDRWTGYPGIRPDWTCGEHTPFPSEDQTT